MSTRGTGDAPYSLFAACVRRVIRRYDTHGSCGTSVLLVLAGFGLPTLCALNLGLYVWGMDTTLGSTEGDISIGGDVIGIQDVLTVFDLTLFTALAVFKDASAWLLTGIVGIFSGAWPVVNLTMLSYCWCVATVSAATVSCPHTAQP